MTMAGCLGRMLALISGLGLAACSVAPPQQVPTAPVATHWKSLTGDGWINTADVPMVWGAGQWWALFDDTSLDRLMRRLELDNPSLALAAANVRQARALLAQAEAAWWPTLGVDWSQQRSGKPARGSASLGLQASWAPDLWDRVGSTVRGRAANVQASEADLAGARLAAQSELARAYFGVREADAELDLMTDLVAGYERAETITRNRYESGIAAHTDLLQAETTLQNAQGSVTALRGVRASSEQAIAVLMGQPPAAFSLPKAAWSPAVPPVPLSLPSGLLLRRPDIASAERAVVAANAEIGVARAAYFPSLNLSANLGGTANHLANLISAPTLAWSLGASAAQFLFDGGQRHAVEQQALAVHEAATARYQQTVLKAFGEVEGRLTDLDTLTGQIRHAEAAAQAAVGAETRMLNRYEAGLSAYTEVVTAQASALNARRSVLQLKVQRQQTAVALIEAVGGGWMVPWRDELAAGVTTPSPAERNQPITP